MLVAIYQDGRKRFDTRQALLTGSSGLEPGRVIAVAEANDSALAQTMVRTVMAEPNAPSCRRPHPPRTAGRGLYEITGEVEAWVR